MNRKELVEKLELVSRALSDSGLIPLFQCFVFDKTTVNAYDDALGIVAPCTTDVAFAVHGKTLLGLLKASQSEDVSFSIDGYEVIIKAGRSTFKLPFHAESDFLFKPPSDDWDYTFQLDEARLTGLAACLTTSSKDLAAPALMGVTLSSAFYSSDGDAITKHTVEWPKLNAPCMLPNAFCEAILRVVAETAHEGSQTLELNKEWAKAALTSGYSIYGRLIANPDPIDFEDTIKQTVKTPPTYVPVPQELDAALSRARIVADPESKPTLLTVEAGRLRLYTDTPLGVVKDAMPFSHPDVSALVSPELLQRAIGLTTEMAIQTNCCVFKNGETLFQLLSNFG